MISATLFLSMGSFGIRPSIRVNVIKIDFYVF